MSTVWRYFDPYFRYEHELTGTSQAWSGHRLFAYDLVRNTKPKRIVELGTHHGNSFFAMSEAVYDEGLLDTELIAVDTWSGDKHAGFYEAHVFDRFKNILSKYYAPLKARFIKETFENALHYIPNQSVDLLHIDGLHTYEAVKQDFNQWYDKVADGGIIIFHDVHEFKDDFGVHILWEELKERFPTVSFFHSHGLGVLIKGTSQYTQFFKEHEDIWRRYYHVAYDLKKAKEIIVSHHEEKEQLATLNGQLGQQISLLEEKLLNLEKNSTQLEEDLERLEHKRQIDIAWVTKEHDETRRERDTLITQTSRLTEEILNQAQELARAYRELESSRNNYNQLERTVRSWEIKQQRYHYELDRAALQQKNLKTIIGQLENRVQAGAATVSHMQHELSRLHREIAYITGSKFWKLRHQYLRMKWATKNPLKFLKKYVSSHVPNYPEIRDSVHRLLKKNNTNAAWPQANLGSRLDNVSAGGDIHPSRFFTKHVTPGSIAVIIHLYHVDMWDAIVERLKHIRYDFHLLVSITQGVNHGDITERIRKWKSDAVIVVLENKGLDIIPFVKLLEKVPLGVKYLLKIHTKKSPYNPSFGLRWFADLMDHVLPSPDYVDGVLHNLEYTDAGMIGGSDTPPLGKIFHSSEVREAPIDLIYKTTGESDTDFYWISGSIFWVRFDLVKKLLDKKLVRLLEKHQPTGYRENGTIAHAMERYFGKLVYDAGRVIYPKPQIRYGSEIIRTTVDTRPLPLNHGSKKNYYVFFNICCINNYREVVQELMGALQDSGLYDRTTKIFYTLVGIPTETFKKEMRAYSKTECVYMSSDISDVEYPMISFMYEYANRCDGYFLYFHTKGVSAPHDPIRIAWRNRLVEKTITEYKKCVDFLATGSDVAGCGWKEHPHRDDIVVPYTIYKYSHFSGNFFWATSDYIKSLPNPKHIEANYREYKGTHDVRFEEYRVMCEMWIGINNPSVGVNGDLNVDYMHTQ